MQFSFRKASIYAIISIAVLATSFFKIADLDFWWHLKTGQIIIEQKQFQRSEIYSYTAQGREYIDHEWLFQTLMFLFYSPFGSAGVIFLKCTVLILVFVLTTKHLFGEGATPSLVFAVQLIALCGGLPRMIERPEIFTALFFITTFLIVDCFLKSGKRTALLFLPPLFTLWANFHAAVILGLVLLGSFSAGLLLEFILSRTGYPAYYNTSLGDQSIILLVLLACFFASAINPYGFRVLLVPFELTSLIDSGLLRNEEWMRPSPFTLPFYYICILVTFITALLNFRHLSFAHFLLAVIFGYISMKYIRNTGMFCWFMPLFLSPYVRRLSSNFSATRVGAVVAALSLLYLTTAAFPFERGIGVASYFPDRIASFTKNQNLQGNLMNSYGFGGYLIWALYPERKIFIDGRNEVYIPLLQKLAKSKADSRQWTSLLAEYHIEYALLNYIDDLEEVTYMKTDGKSEITYMPFSETHFPRSRWALVYWDDDGMVLIKRDGKNFKLVPKEYSSVYPEGFQYLEMLVRNQKLSKERVIQELERKLSEDPSCRRAQNLLNGVKDL